MGDCEFRTKNFTKPAWIQSAPVKVNGVVVGSIEVGYLEQKPNENEGPFLKEERLLIDAITERIGRITERKQAEEALLITKESLEEANLKLQIALARENQLAHTDALTGINNRRHLYELAEREFEIAARYQHPLSAIMFDIDNFKEVNDTFGHAVGDQMLERVTQVACAELRSADVIGRYGGEEFVIISPMTNAQQAHPLAERIRERVAAIRIPTENWEATVTLSIGIAEMIHGTPGAPGLQTRSAEALIRYADKAMYAAKNAGRNRTEVLRREQ
jgi:diguanylate cyclase (GGDEF)-like protein